jgi:hypothetical protein
MKTKTFLPLSLLLLALVTGCQGKPAGQEAAAPGSATPPPASTPQPAPVAPAQPAGTQAAPATAPPSATATSAPAPATAPAPAAQAAAPGAAPPPAAAPAIARQTTNWPGVSAEVVEFRRKGSTLTARVTLHNTASDTVEPDIHINEVYVVDLGAGKKYEVLKDEKGTYIASLHTGYNNRWFERMAPGTTYTIWLKFPAPPPEVKSATLQVPGIPLFEDLPIQDS